MANSLCDEEWQLVRTFLPDDLDASARATRALTRARGFGDAETLLRVLLLHIAGGLSLAQASLRAEELGWTKISAVALFKRLRSAQAWLQELCGAVLARQVSGAAWPLPGRRFRAVDASDIREPGATGSSWKLHYSIALPSLQCDYAAFTDCRQGERLQNFPLQAGDVILADRAYGKRGQLAALREAGADAIVRVHPPAFPTLEVDSAETDLPVAWAEKLAQLPAVGAGEWRVAFRHQQKRYEVRVCAVRKSQTAAAEARRKAELESRRRGYQLNVQSPAMADYVVVLTTLPKEELSAEQVLELYRCRWQVELAFKRLKSLLHLSAVPKSRSDCARAWMQGKLLEALLLERLLEEARALSPWGYRLGRGVPLAPLPGSA